MCGRFTQKFTWSELIELYRLTQPPQNLRPNYNVCPTDQISVILPGDKGLFLMPMRWQLIPRWWKKSLKETPGDVQCQGRDNCRNADVPRRLQTSTELLRSLTGVSRQAGIKPVTAVSGVSCSTLGPAPASSCPGSL